MRTFMAKKTNKGFTLIELVVVIAILGILAVIAIPRLGGFTLEAKDSANQANDKIARNTAALWLSENGKPSTTMTWDGTRGQAWEKYLGTWPEGIKKVDIGTDGNISVTLDTTGSQTPHPIEPDANAQQLVDDAITASTFLSVTTLNPASEENPRILVPESINGITFTLVSSDILIQDGASIEIGPGGTYATIKRHKNQDRSGHITLQASLNGMTATKTFLVTIPSGTGNVLVLP